MRKSWIRDAGIGKKPSSVSNAPVSASYLNYQSNKTRSTNAAGPATNPLPAGNRIGPKNKTRGFKPGTNNIVNATVDARIGSGPKVGFDPGAKRVPFAPSPTSKKRSSGKPGPSKYVGNH